MAAAGRLASIAAVNPSSITKKATCQATVQRLSADPDRSLPNPGGEQRLATDRSAQGRGRHFIVPSHHIAWRTSSTDRLMPASIDWPPKTIPPLDVRMAALVAW